MRLKRHGNSELFFKVLLYFSHHENFISYKNNRSNCYQYRYIDQISQNAENQTNNLRSEKRYRKRGTESTQAQSAIDV